MKRTAVLTFQYYCILFLYNVAFTILWIGIALFGFGELSSIVLFWAKVSGFISAAFIQYYSAKESYFYFRNAGYRMRKIIITTFLTELLSFIALLLLFTLIIHETTYLKS